MLEYISVNTKKKLDLYLSHLKSQGRTGIYDKFYTPEGTYYVLFYKTKEV